jgi:HAD superfamily hydrolase (TIGR01509 family)
MAALEAKNLAPRFKFILCIEDYQGRKPEPAPYLAAKTKMQQIAGHSIDAKECLVIEDDPKGVESGTAAGMIVLHRPVSDDDTEKFLTDIRNF